MAQARENPRLNVSLTSATYYRDAGNEQTEKLACAAGLRGHGCRDLGSSQDYLLWWLRQEIAGPAGQPSNRRVAWRDPVRTGVDPSDLHVQLER